MSQYRKDVSNCQIKLINANLQIQNFKRIPTMYDKLLNSSGKLFGKKWRGIHFTRYHFSLKAILIKRLWVVYKRDKYINQIELVKVQTDTHEFGYLIHDTDSISDE